MTRKVSRQAGLGRDETDVGYFSFQDARRRRRGDGVSGSSESLASRGRVLERASFAVGVPARARRGGVRARLWSVCSCTRTLLVRSSSVCGPGIAEGQALISTDK